jgi:NAD-dependent deacetylase
LFFNDPKPASSYNLPNKLKVFPLSAVEGMKIVKDELMNTNQKTSNF